MSKISILAMLSALTFLTYAVGAQVPSSGLAVYYPFDNSLLDLSQNSNNAVSIGATFGPDRFGNTSGALVLSTTTGAISQNNLGVSGNSARTISLWIKPDPGSTWPQGFMLEWGTDDNGKLMTLLYSPWQYEDQPIRNLGLFGFNHDAKVLTTPSDLSNGWSSVIVTYSVSLYDTKFYLNGVLQINGFEVVSNGVMPNAALDTTDTPLSINRIVNGGVGGYSGSMDDLRIYSYALNGTEVSQLYNAEVVPEPTTSALLLLSGTAAVLWMRRKR